MRSYEGRRAGVRRRRMGRKVRRIPSSLSLIYGCVPLRETLTWTGQHRVRLYSTKSFKPLGTLSYHKKNCQSVAFARSQLQSLPREAAGGGDEEEDEMSEDEKEERARWLVSGGQDNRVAIWSLIEFGKT